MKLKNYKVLTVLVCLFTLVSTTVMAASIGRGSTGSEVMKVQKMLIAQGYLVDVADGAFGNNTEYAVRVFQKSKNLNVDGRVGAATMKALEENNKAFAKNNSNASGTPKNYKRVIDMHATAYSSQDPGNGNYTARGNLLRRGLVSVDPDVIPLGTELYIEGYGYAVADDTGGAIQGHRIDLAMDTHSEAINFGRRDVRVYVL